MESAKSIALLDLEVIFDDLAFALERGYIVDVMEIADLTSSNVNGFRRYDATGGKTILIKTTPLLDAKAS